MEKIIGIDLGTTFSAVAAVQEGAPRLLSDGAQKIVPSVVGFTPAGELVVGEAARNQLALYPDATVRSIKRRMGDEEGVALNGRDYSPAEISALVLREMKRIAEVELGGEVGRAVITVPAFFSDAARQATREAGELAGFKVERIINEPTAAALAYGLERGEADEIIAVYDLGGGTFDVSIVEMNAGVLEVRASHGDTQLGGDDFDEALMNFLADAFEQEHEVDPRENAAARARLLRAAENAKITLSAQPFARVREEYLLEKEGKPLHLDTEVSRSEFDDLIAEMVDKTLSAFDMALADAGLEPDELDRVIFVGGSTRIPLVWNRVKAHTGQEPMTEINPDEAVALGAAAQAAIIAGEPLDAILVDVTPHSLGIEVADFQMGRIVEDRYSAIIARNSTLPTTRAQVFSALHPDQDAINLKVYQGESEIASRNTLLGEFLFENLKPETRGEPPRVTVEFDLDINGILHVNAIDRGSGKARQTTLQAAHTKLDPASKAAASRHLAELSEATADEDDADTDISDLMVERARELIAESPAETNDLAGALADWESARKAGDTARAAEIHEALLELLYEFDDD